MKILACCEAYFFELKEIYLVPALLRTIFIPFKDCDLEAALIEKEALEKGWRQTEINGALCWVDRNGKIVEKKKFSSKHTEHVDSLDFDDENSEMKSTIAQSTMQFFSG